MCGICGASRDADGRAVRAMNGALRHRGPDDAGVHIDEVTGTALGATRLSIIDLEGGHQPLSNEDGTVVAALNGEIYNFPLLREQLRARGHTLATSCDTEVLVHLYEDYGPDLVHALDGMYAFAIWDARRRRLVVARDRFGEKPLFYRQTPDGIVFASELTALLAAGGPREIDRAAVDAYFVLGYVPGPATMIEGVRQLPPGHLLLVEDGSVELRSYWHPPALTETLDADDVELVDELERLLMDSVRSRMIADVPLGVFLSGGTDSTLVTSLATEVSSHRVKTFTVGYDLGEVSEADPARAAADALGTEHHELTLRQGDVADLARDLFTRLDQPVADQALLASYAVARFAGESVKVVVGGEGADELFAGYPRYRYLALADRLDGRVPPAAGRLAAAGIRRMGIEGRAQRLAHVIEPVPAIQRHLDWVTEGRSERRAAFYGPGLESRFSSADLARRLPDPSAAEQLGTARTFMLQDQALWLPDDVLAKADRASMLASLEVRTPFLQPALADLAAAIPIERHLRDGGKALLREILARRQPAGTPRRSKVAFRVPAAEWLRGPLAPVIREQAADSALYRGGYMNRQAVTTAIAEHVSGRRDWSAVLWPLMVLAFWVDRVGAAGGF